MTLLSWSDPSWLPPIQSNQFLLAHSSVNLWELGKNKLTTKTKQIHKNLCLQDYHGTNTFPVPITCRLGCNQTSFETTTSSTRNSLLPLAMHSYSLPDSRDQKVFNNKGFTLCCSIFRTALVYTECSTKTRWMIYTNH